jgi:hypothetical protein
LYPYLVDEVGNWTVRDDVRNVQVTGSGLGEMEMLVNEWLNIGQSNRSIIGPEIGIGHYIRQATNEPVLLLKSCIGNRAFGWDLLPPGSEEYEFTDSEGWFGCILGTEVHRSVGKKALIQRSQLLGMQVYNTTGTLQELNRY